MDQRLEIAKTFQTTQSDLQIQYKGKKKTKRGTNEIVKCLRDHFDFKPYYKATVTKMV